MPKESLSVYLSAVDGMSPVLASITDKTKALDKESQQLQQTYEALQKANRTLIERKTELQKKLQEVNEEVKEARKQFKDLGDEASSDALNKAVEKQAVPHPLPGFQAGSGGDEAVRRVADPEAGEQSAVLRQSVFG